MLAAGLVALPKEVSQETSFMGGPEEYGAEDEEEDKQQQQEKRKGAIETV